MSTRIGLVINDKQANTLGVKEIKAILDEKGIEYNKNAKKPELLEILKNIPEGE